MGYRDREKSRIIALRDELFADAGGGIFSGAARDFVLADPRLNLYEGVRAGALDYFARNSIAWWKGDGEDGPADRASPFLAGRLRQSSVCAARLPACGDSTAAGARSRRGDLRRVDDGYVEFEFTGERPRLSERSFSRGAHCTSVDAAMIGQLRDDQRRLFLIEWKYTECYDGKALYIPERARVYDALITAEDSPFKPVEPGALYFEPFYQLMRQTLLAHLLAKHGDHGCSSYLHVHVTPKEKRRLPWPRHGQGA